MNDDKETRAKFAAIMLGVAENYGQTITAEGGNLRFKALQAYPLEEIEAAAMSIMFSRKYTSMPTVADFVEHLGGGSIEDLAEVEAGKALHAIGRVGRYDSVVFDDPTTMAVIRNGYGGWPKLCAECGVEEPERWFRRNFAKMWAAYRRQGVRVYGVLPGAHEMANAAGGAASFIPQPRFIGNEERARNVLAMGSGDAAEVPGRAALFAVSAASEGPFPGGPFSGGSFSGGVFSGDAGPGDVCLSGGPARRGIPRGPMEETREAAQ